MGFADYLSRHFKNKPPPSSEDDTKYIINLINDFRFGLNKNSIKNMSTNRTVADNYQPNKNAANNYPQANKFDSAFCPNTIQFKLPCFTAKSIHSNSENSKLINSFKHNSNSINSLIQLNQKPFQTQTSKIQLIPREKWTLLPEINLVITHLNNKLLKEKETPTDQKLKWPSTKTTCKQLQLKHKTVPIRAVVDPQSDLIRTPHISIKQHKGHATISKKFGTSIRWGVLGRSHR